MAENLTKTSSKYTNLVVDDEEKIRNLLVTFLSRLGHSCFTAIDGVDALNKMKENRIDVVITDVKMPNMDGITLTEKNKTHAKYKHLPVIALTTLAAEEDVARGRAVGVNEYHIKLDKERLMESVHRYAKAAMAA